MKITLVYKKSFDEIVKDETLRDSIEVAIWRNSHGYLLASTTSGEELDLTCKTVQATADKCVEIIIDNYEEWGKPNIFSIKLQNETLKILNEDIEFTIYVNYKEKENEEMS